MDVKLGPSQREEYRLKMFENRLLRKIFGPKKEEVTANQRKLHNEELHGLFSYQIVLRG
jgi:hypothetical protein